MIKNVPTTLAGVMEGCEHNLLLNVETLKQGSFEF